MEFYFLLQVIQNKIDDYENARVKYFFVRVDDDLGLCGDVE
jgi:hypothetical protein